MGDAEVHHQRHRTRRVREVTSQLDVPTSLTPAPNHLLRLYFVGCAKEVSKLINRPVVSLFGTRVSGTGANMIAESVNDKLFATTSRERKLTIGSPTGTSTGRRGLCCVRPVASGGMVVHVSQQRRKVADRVSVICPSNRKRQTFVGQDAVGRQSARSRRQDALMEALNNAGRQHPILEISNLCVDKGGILMRGRRGLHRLKPVSVYGVGVTIESVSGPQNCLYNGPMAC